MKYTNPVIPGFYPDPSVCRVGEDYYLVNSSFEFFPGVPLSHSRDLVHWEQIGHVLTRESQLSLAGCHASGGIFAPTLRHHNGRFYMITTNITGGWNFLVWADSITGPWSDPVWIDHKGIDPSLFWDDDGTAYYQGTGFDGNGQGIVQFALEPETGRIISEKKIIWYGTGGKCPEGPHMYKRNGWYYLMIAEGGTEYGHMETVARSKSPWGPFESCPRNPILTHRDTAALPDLFQGLGHADLIDDPHGNWWLLFHGFRPSQHMLHHIGRETMLAPVVWDEDGWPLVNGGKLISSEMEGPGEDSPGHVSGGCFTADFVTGNSLSPRWAALRQPLEKCCKFENGLVLTASEYTLDDLGEPAFAGVRQQHFDVVAETVLEDAPAGEGSQAGLTVFHTNEHHYDLLVTRLSGKRAVVLRRRVGDMVVESQPVFLPGTGKILLRVEADRLCYRFFAGPAGEEPGLVGQGRSQLLSTEIMLGTFTGCFFALFCQGQPGARARFEQFSYRPIVKG